MTFRLLLTFAVLVLPLTAHAADCVDIQEGYDAMGRRGVQLAIAEAEQARSLCGPLKVIERRLEVDDVHIDIYATYVVFEPATTDAERRYNEWVNKKPARMNFLGPIGRANGSSISDTMFGTLYRSPEILSARISGWICCGAHGNSWSDVLNINPKTGQDIRLDDLVEIAPVADRCWKTFAELTGPMKDQGKIFGEHYPRSDFVKIVRGAHWSAQQSGLAIDFDYLLGYVGAEFVCPIRNEDLPRFVKAGVSVPL
jgi:hypothetical protein